MEKPVFNHSPQDSCRGIYQRTSTAPDGQRLSHESRAEVGLKNSRKPWWSLCIYVNQLLMGEKTTSECFFCALSDLQSFTQWSLLKHSWGAVGVALFRQARRSSEEQTSSPDANEPSEIAGKLFLVGSAKYHGLTGPCVLLCPGCTCWMHTLHDVVLFVQAAGWDPN